MVHQKLAECAAGPASDTPTQTPVELNTEAYRSSSIIPMHALHTTPAIVFCASPKGRASGPEVRGPKARVPMGPVTGHQRWHPNKYLPSQREGSCS
jgi:hypothetical protein